jgi:hypothetical protein
LLLYWASTLNTRRFNVESKSRVIPAFLFFWRFFVLRKREQNRNVIN